MTECFIQSHSESDEACSCGNCDWQGPASDLDMITDIQERIEAGEEVPAGQCPECDALAYLDSKANEEAAQKKDDDAKANAARAMLAALEAMNYVDPGEGYCICPACDGVLGPEHHSTTCNDARNAIAQARAAGIEPQP